jgi:ubiquinone/menaquinone biosynthesis C-methylase UbiE
MSKTEQSRKAYNKKAANYDNTYDGRVTRIIKQLLLDTIEVKPNLTIIDVACGTGSLIYELSKRANVKAYGIDISEEMIRIATKTYDGVSFSLAPAYPIHFNDSSVDVIVVSAAFHHFEQPQEFANECFRILNNNGVLYIGEFNFPIIIRQLLNFFLPIMKTGDVKVYSIAQLSSFFTKAGFIIEEVKTESNFVILKCKNENRANRRYI